MQVIVVLTRLGLCGFGVFLFAGGLVEIALGDELRSEQPRPDPVNLRMFGVAMLCYGVVLMLHWRLLAHVLPLAALLASVVAALSAAVVFRGAEHDVWGEPLLRLTALLAPLIVAMAFVIRDRRRLLNGPT